MRRTIRLGLLLMLTLMARTATASPGEIDLSVEKADFERLSVHRNAGLTLAGGAIGAGAGSAWMFVQTIAARATLLAQTNPINVAERSALVDRGHAQNSLAWVLVGSAVALGLISVFQLQESF